MTITRRLQRLFGGHTTGELYECRNCGKGYELNRQACVHCGSFRIERSSYDDLVSVDQSA